MPDSVITLAERYRARLYARDDAALRRIIAVYGGLYRRLQTEIDSLALELVGVDNPSLSQERRRALVAQLEREIGKFSSWLEVELQESGRAAALMAGQHTGTMLTTLGVSFNRLPVQAIETVLGFLDPGGALMRRLAAMPNVLAENVAQAIIDAIGLHI